MRNPFTKLVNSVKNLFTGKKVETPSFVPQKQEAVPFKLKRTHYPAWWTVLFGLPNPDKLSLDKRVVKMQGSFSALRPLGLSRKDWNKLYQIKRGRR